MNIFQKAAANLNLTPGERALLKTLQSLAITALITAFLTIASFLGLPGAINVHDLVYVVFVAVLFSLGHGIAKVVTANGDEPLGDAIEAVTEAAEKRLPPTNASGPPA
jgi:hypothetical protein